MHRLIRPVVRAVITGRRDGALLDSLVGTDPDRRVRPVGGGIEFGEAAQTAVDDDSTYSAGRHPVPNAPDETAFWWAAGSRPARIVPEPLAAFVGPIAS